MTATLTARERDLKRQAAYYQRNKESLKAYAMERWRSLDDDQRSARRISVSERWRIHADAVDAIKLASGCIDCGYNAHSAALEFDHLPGTVKLFCIGAAKGRSMARVLAEIAKCEIVCANCHRVRTAARK